MALILCLNYIVGQDIMRIILQKTADVFLKQMLKQGPSFYLDNNKAPIIRNRVRCVQVLGDYIDYIGLSYCMIVICDRRREIRLYDCHTSTAQLKRSIFMCEKTYRYHNININGYGSLIGKYIKKGMQI